MKKYTLFYQVILLMILLMMAGCQSIQGSGSTSPSDNPSPSTAIDTAKPKETAPSLPPAPKENVPSVKEKETEKPIQGYYVDEKSAIHATSPQKGEKIILLTFDDSPAGKTTPKILDILDKYHAKAIWFVNGYYAEKHQDLLKEIQKRGHLIGNHTWWHENLKKLSPEKTKEEIVSLNDLVEKATGVRPKFFRPPFGVNSEEAYKVLKDEKMQAMNWTWGSLDWELKKPEEIEKNVITHVRNGSNILFHDKEITAEALEGILKKLSEEGYQFVLPTEVRVKED